MPKDSIIKQVAVLATPGLALIKAGRKHETYSSTVIANIIQAAYYEYYYGYFNYEAFKLGDNGAGRDDTAWKNLKAHNLIEQRGPGNYRLNRKANLVLQQVLASANASLAESPEPEWYKIKNRF